MNKLGLVNGFILLPFLFSMFVPWGRSILPIHLFDSGTQYFGIWGITPAGMTTMLNINYWWFATAEPRRILCGTIFWFFTLFAMFLCIVGSKQPEARGKKMYIAAFFLLLVVIVMFFIDALGLGSLFLPRVYSFFEFMARWAPGFYIFIGDTILILFAAITYKEA
nr:hypothetical protein [Candidatus Sigynarchaeum springense]MDO8118553.1 hypothetical protein [Candidatus Sigynarchaeota archaeon]